MKISVIMPIYNGANTLERAINSVISQKGVDIELLIIDGGSKDNTKDIVNKYKNYVNYFVSEPDQGYADALNKGICQSTGDYIIMLAADDYFVDGCFIKAVDSLCKDTDVWCGAMIKETKYGTFLDQSNRDLNQLYRRCSLRHPATLFKTSVLKEIKGYDISYRCAADRELFLRLYTKGYKFQIEDIPMVIFTTDGMSETSLQPFIDDKNISLKYGVSLQQAEKNYKQDVKNINSKLLITIKKTAALLNNIGFFKITYRVLGIPNNYLLEFKR